MFKRIYKLCGKNVISKNAEQGIIELMKFFKKIRKNKNILDRKSVRINQLKYLIKKGIINKIESLRVKNASPKKIPVKIKFT